MSRVVASLCVLSAVGIGGTAWVMLQAGASEQFAVPAAATGPTTAPAPAAAALQQARATCRPEALDPVIDALQATTKGAGAPADAWHQLAEACLERALLRSHERGLVVGSPTFAQLPPAVGADVDAGLAAVARARELGDDGADLFRIEAALLSQRVTGLGAALQWNGRIQTALQEAGRRQPDDPRLHTALGLRKLLAPKLLGHDPAKALQHFEFAAQALAHDERPAVFAAMASHLQRKRLQAIGWLERAVERNPQNRFARVVLARLRGGEDDPFGRDVTAAEAAALKD